MKKKGLTKDIEWLAVISGPEPQRTVFEKKVIQCFRNLKGRRIIVQGLVGNQQTTKKIGGIQLVNYMLKEELENRMNRAHIIISRSGYSTLMDMSQIQPRAILIPTPHQYEQVYLAKRMNDLRKASSIQQHSLQQMDQVLNLKGHTYFSFEADGHQPFDSNWLTRWISLIGNTK